MQRTEKAVAYSKIPVAIAILLFIASMTYWSLYSITAYNHFNENYDLATYTYNVYYYLHYAGSVPGFQILAFGSHIAPDMWVLVAPFYALFPSALTLLLVQDAAVSLAGLAAFFVARNLTGKEYVALALAAAFLINPGVHGMMTFDFHPEAFIPLFYILTFYFYMRLNTKAFLASFALLLGSLETVVVLTAMLGVALLVYEKRYNKDARLKSERQKLALALIAGSLLAGGAYYLMTVSINGSYAAGHFVLPQTFSLVGGAQNQVSSELTSSIASPSSLINIDLAYAFDYPHYVQYALAVVFLSFGLAIYFDFTVSVLLALPFLAAMLLDLKPISITPVVSAQYFAYVIPCMLVAAILGIIVAAEKKAGIVRALDRRRIDWRVFVIATCLAGAIMLYLLSPMYSFNRYVQSLPADLALQTPAGVQVLDNQIYSLLSVIPANASVMAQNFTMPHLTQREYLEPIASNSFAPQYILVDFNDNVSPLAGSESSLFRTYIYYHDNYSVYAQNGSAVLYRIK